MTTTTQLNFPSLDGSLNIPEAVNFNLEHNKDQTIYVFSTPDFQSTVSVSHLEFGRATHRAAYAVRPNHNISEDGMVVAVIALADTIVFQTVVVGLMQAGYVPFPISPRNSPAAVVNLLQKTSCHTILGTMHTLKPLFEGIAKELSTTVPEYPVEIREIPVLKQLYPKLGEETEGDAFGAYPSPAIRPSLGSTAIYMHSSGSTGFPKPIKHTFQTMIEWSSTGMKQIREFETKISVGAMALPAFHAFGIAAQVLQPIYSLVSIGIYTPTVLTPQDYPIIPTSENLFEHLKATKCNSAMVVPALLKDWAESEEKVALLKTFQTISFSGGPMVRTTGDKLAAAGVNLHGIYGGTEIGPTNVYPLKKGYSEFWEWIKFNDRVQVKWDDQGDGTYECQILTSDTHHPAVLNLSNPSGYATSDLFERHPSRPDCWRIIGRKDDVIIHSSGEKTVPAPMEGVMVTDMTIRGALMFGREHDQAGVIVEPEVACATPEERVAFRDSIWNTIEKANQNAPAFSRIYKEMVIIVTPDKPLPRAPKGTVMRKAALRLYGDEIVELYKTVETSSGTRNITPPSDWKIETVVQWLIGQSCDILSQSEVSATKDLFEQGLDSLSATFLRLRIVAILRASANSHGNSALPNIPQNVIYNYPVISNLAQFIVSVVEDPDHANTTVHGKDAIEAMIHKYSADLVVSDIASNTASSTTGVSSEEHGSIILLTGSTGNIAAHVLFLLLQDSTVGRIYTLNRPSHGNQTIFERHEARFADKGFDVALLHSEKLVFLEGEASSDHLGLDHALYTEIQKSVTHIIHSAWRLDFNLTLPSFESSIHGTRNLIDFAREGPHAATLRFLFTSSVASTQSWDPALGPYPEHMVEDAKYAIGGGYGEGKYVSERILARSGLKGCSLRIGQVSGGQPNGAWATSDWLPILVKSSVALGALPDADHDITWTTMDSVAQSVLDIAFTLDEMPFAMNIVHPRPVPWLDMINDVADALVSKHISEEKLPIVPFDQWLSKVEEHSVGATEEVFQKIPAIKLLDFYRSMRPSEAHGKSGGIAHFDTTLTQKVSKTIRVMPSLGREDAQRWVDYWTNVKFLN